MSDELKPIIEALIFASPDPLTPKTLFKLLDGEPQEDVERALDALQADYDERGGLQMVQVAGGYQICTRPEFHEWVRRLFHEHSKQAIFLNDPTDQCHTSAVEGEDSFATVIFHRGILKSRRSAGHHYSRIRRIMDVDIVCTKRRALLRSKADRSSREGEVAKNHALRPVKRERRKSFRGRLETISR